MLNVTSGSLVLSGSSGLGFGQFANGGAYTGVGTGVFNPSGSGTGVTSTMLFQSAPTLTANTSYMLIAAGRSGQTGTLAPQFLLAPNYTTDTLTIPAGDAAIRVINVSSNPNAVGLFATNAGTPTSALATSFASITYGYTGAANPYVAVPTTQLANLALVDATNTTVPLSLSTSSTLNNVTFVSGQAYTLYVFGQPANSDQPLGAVWVQDFPTL